MDRTIITIIVVAAALVAVAAILAAVWMYLQRRRQTKRLQSRFGPEYDRLAAESDRRRAEETLHERERRVEKLNLVSLSPEDRDRFVGAWLLEQAGFVDDPQAAVANADRLVTEVMRARGYPMGDFEQQAADISVDHSPVVRNYRIAHDIALRGSGGETSTEELRTALLHYRLLFEDLLDVSVSEPEKQKAASVKA